MKTDEYIQKEKKLKHLYKQAGAVLSDPQSIKYIGFNLAEHLRNIGLSTIANDSQSNTVYAIAELYKLFPEQNKPIEAQDVLEKKQRWSKRQVKETEQKLRAFFNPHEVIDSVFGGNRHVSHKEMAVVQQSHPKLLEEVRNNLLVKSNSGRAQLNKQQEARVSRLFNMPMHSRQLPAYGQAIKTMFQINQMQAQAKGQRGQKGMGLVRQLQTAQQRREQNV